MHAKVIEIQIRPGKMEGAIEIFRHTVDTILMPHHGLVDAQLLTNVCTGRALMITLWAHANDLAMVEARGHFQAQIERFQPVLGAPVHIEQYEVSVSPSG